MAAESALARYAVIGHPIAHSRSPWIHAAFARQTAQHLVYDRLLAPLDGFAATVADFVADGGQGLNVTVPFKLEAYGLCDRVSARAAAAGAVNTLRFADGTVYGDNTDGVGLVRDITVHLGQPLTGRRILIIGAGGATRGVMQPLLAEQPAAMTIVNRTADKASELAAAFAGQRGGCALRGGAFDDVGDARFDIIVNATSASLHGDLPAVSDAVYAQGALAYDMMYAAAPTAWMRHALAAGTARASDGLGMLVEQAAESFFIWRGVMPDTAPVLAALREEIMRGQG